MTVGGTGDVLAGVAGALLCHLPAFEAACIAAYVNGTGRFCCGCRARGRDPGVGYCRQDPVSIVQEGMIAW